jgi:Ca-activated chloride channel family protein
MVLLCGSVAGSAWGAGLLVADGGFGGVLTIEDHRVEVTVNHGIATTVVTQRFRNQENRIVEALYTFPVPRGATVSGFSMWIGGKEMVGEVIEKSRARRIYNSYKRKRQDPGLLEQVDFKSFELRIFPIPARAVQRVKITYYQELAFEGNRGRYRYPLATSTRKGVDAQAHGPFRVQFDVRSPLPITALSCDSHSEEAAVVKHTPMYWQASIEKQGGDLSRDLVFSFTTARAQTGVDVLSSRVAGEDGYFLLTLTAGPELKPRKSGMDFVILADVSGSMARSGKLDTAVRLIHSLVQSMTENDRLELILFSASPKPLLQGLKRSDPSIRERIANALKGIEPRGGTELPAALALAYAYADPARPFNVILVSDGLSGQGERGELMRSIGARPDGARVFTVGVGNDVNKPLLRQMAEEAGGLADFLSRQEDPAARVAAMRGRLTREIAGDLQIHVEGAYEVEPRLLPALFYGRPVRIYGRYRKGGEVPVRVTANVAGRALAQTTTVTLAEAGDAHPELERMWARRRIDSQVRLLGRIAEGDPRRDSLQEEIVGLGEGYSIATEYTSFLALERDQEYVRWRVQRRNARRVLRDRQVQEKLRMELAALRRQTAAGLGPVASKPMEDAPLPEAVAGDGQVPRRSPPSSAPSTRGGNLRFGAALDPISGSLALGLGAAAWAARRRRKEEEHEEG